MPWVRRRANSWLAFLVFWLVVLSLLLWAHFAHASTEPKLPAYPAMTCEDAKRIVAEMGKVRALALAIENGLSIKQIYQIRRTCRV
jgi:4-amino-4-deoxy-L-arabinose transferase-like glycosyltransferase